MSGCRDDAMIVLVETTKGPLWSLSSSSAVWTSGEFLLGEIEVDELDVLVGQTGIEFLGRSALPGPIHSDEDTGQNGD